MIIAILLTFIVSALAYLAYNRWTEIITISVIGLWVIYLLVFTGFVGLVVIGGFVTGDLFVMFMSAVILFISVIMVLTLEPHEQMKKIIHQINKEKQN